jgi:DnaD/phage-associated family protein
MSQENELCRVRDPELLDKTLKKIDKELENKFNHEIKIESKFDIVASKAKDNEIATEEELYELIKSNIVYSIMAYQINVNGEKIGIVNSEYEAKSIIEEVKNYFTKDYDKETLLEVTTVEDIEIKQVKATNAEIQDKDKLIDYIIKGTNEEKKYTVEKGDSFWTIAEHFDMDLEELLLANSATEDDILQIGDELNLIVPKPFINVQVKRKVVQEEKMPYETEYTYVSYMYNDEEIVTKRGKYGISEIEAIVTEQNGLVVAKEVLSEKVITEPVTQIVTTGTQEPPPSQGTGYFINPLPGSMITSRFGSRAGGFHLGQDMDTMVEYLEKRNDRFSTYSRISKALGFNRTLTEAEMRLIDKWIDEWEFSMEMILRCLDNSTKINNPNLNYFDKILDDWYKNGYKTIEDLKNDKKPGKTRKESSKTKNKFHNFIQSDDITGEDLEKIARERFEKKLNKLGLAIPEEGDGNE